MLTSKYVARAEKFSRVLLLDKITVDEYAENLLSSHAGLPEIDESTARAVAVTIPEIAREAIGQEIAKVLAPDYRFPDLHYGGPGPSPEMREETRRLYESRVRTYALALASALGTA